MTDDSHADDAGRGDDVSDDDAGRGDDVSDDDAGRGAVPGSLPMPSETGRGGPDGASDDATHAITDAAHGDPDTPSAREAPLSGLARSVRGTVDGRTEFDELFERKDVDELDEEALWEQLEGTADPLEEPTGSLEVAPPVPADQEVRELPKATYCHLCEHFSEPPELRCTHEGTEIIELVDLETFRVAGCPVARREERLERR